MNSFFRGLRTVMAAEIGNKIFGEIAWDGIEKIIIPQVEDKIESDKNPDKWRKILKGWQEYETNTHKIAVAKAAYSAANRAGAKFGLKPNQVQDLLDDIAGTFYVSPSQLKPAEYRQFKNFKTIENPESFIPFFKNTISQHALDDLRKQYTSGKGGSTTSLNKEIGEEGAELGDFVSTKKDIPSEALEIKDLKEAMGKYVKSRLKTKQAKLLFELWQDAAEEDGPENVNWSDLFKPWHKETGYSYPALALIKKEIYKLISEFFLNVEKRPLQRRGSIAARVAYEFSVRKMAQWILKPLR